MSDANLDNDRLTARIMMVSGAMTCLAGLNCGWFGPMVPAIASQQHLTLVEAGSIISVYSGGSLLPLAIGRQLVEKFGGRKCLLSAALLFCCGLAILGVGNNLFLLSVGAALLGIGAGLNSIAGTICILRLATGPSAAAVGKLNVFFGCGALLGPLIAYAGLRSPWSYHAVYLFGAFYALCVLLSALAARKLDVSVQPAAHTDTHFHPLQKPALLYTTCVFMYVGTEVGVATWLFTYLNMTCGLPKELAASSMTALWAGLTAGRMLSVQLFKKFAPSGIALGSMSLVVSAILSLALLPHMGSFALGVVFLLGLGLGPVFPTLISSASERYREHSASVTSLVVTAGAFAGITFPIVIGQVFTRLGHQQGMLLLASTAAILIFVFYTVQFRLAPRNKAESTNSEPVELVLSTPVSLPADVPVDIPADISADISADQKLGHSSEHHQFDRPNVAEHAHHIHADHQHKQVEHQHKPTEHQQRHHHA